MLLSSGGFDACPTGDEFVVGARVFGLPQAFAQGVKAIGKLAHGFGFARNRPKQQAGGGIAALFMGADELMQRFPDGQAFVRFRVPIHGILGPFE